MTNGTAADMQACATDSHSRGHAHSQRAKDTGQSVDPALYGLQKPPLRGHVLLSCHGNAREKREKWVQQQNRFR